MKDITYKAEYITEDDKCFSSRDEAETHAIVLRKKEKFSKILEKFSKILLKLEEVNMKNSTCKIRIILE